MPRALYHFPTSPFSRRARLALAHKKLDVALRDARQEPALLDEARALSPIKTIPILVEPDGRALGDSVAIMHYLDAAYPDAPALWPRGDARAASAALEVAALVDVALDTIVDLGSRYFDLRADAAWPGVKGEMLGRAQRALDALADRAASWKPTVLASGWSAADMCVLTMTAWLEGLPARASTNKNVGQIVTLGWTLPAALSTWADAHRARADVIALG
jgi:glutathione S-transferase